MIRLLAKAGGLIWVGFRTGEKRSPPWRWRPSRQPSSSSKSGKLESYPTRRLQNARQISKARAWSGAGASASRSRRTTSAAATCRSGSRSRNFQVLATIRHFYRRCRVSLVLNSRSMCRGRGWNLMKKPSGLQRDQRRRRRNPESDCWWISSRSTNRSFCRHRHHLLIIPRVRFRATSRPWNDLLPGWTVTRRDWRRWSGSARRKTGPAWRRRRWRTRSDESSTGFLWRRTKTKILNSRMK